MPIIKVTHQGSPAVNTDSVYWKKYDEVILLTIGMRSKYCEILGQGPDNMITIVANERSMHLMDGVDRDEPTDIELTGYNEGWRIFLAEISRYTLRICLEKENVEAVIYDGN